MNGYGGRILRVNLTSGLVKTEPLDPRFAREWIGGRGFAARLLYDEVKRGANPLGEENKVIIASGPLSGVLVPAGAKVAFAAKSPATGGYGESNMGGHFSPEMKYAGYDVIIIEGTAPQPSYLFIEDDKVEIRNAQKYWGKGCLTSEKMLKSDLGEKFQILTIGPAGENLVRFACISHDFGRQAGRTGIGAVFGSKKLKAIAIKGTEAIPVANVKEATRLGKEMFKQIFDNPALKQWQDYGTPGVVNWANEIEAFPTRNFQSEYFEHHKNLSGQLMRDRIVTSDKACFGCPMSCGKYSHTRKTSKYKYNVWVEGPEYETIALCGGNCALPNIEDVAYANWICDELGIDTISSGAVIAFAMECFEKGIISDKDVGRKIRFGDVDSFAYLAKKIAYQKGIGKILARGTRDASKVFGPEAEKLAMQIKGLEISGYSFRNALAMALAYGTCDVGAHHNRAWAITYDIEVGRQKSEGKAAKVIFLQHVRPMFDMLGTCRLQWVELGFELANYPKILEAVTGFKYSLEELLKFSEKVWNLTRMFWVREIKGFGQTYDWPPERFFKVPPRKEKIFLTREIYDQLLREYYKLRGWNKNGIPTRKKLRELNLKFTMGDLPHKKIKLEIQVVGYIKEFFPGERFPLELENSLTIRDILRRLKAKEELVGMVTVNGEPRDKDYVPGDGDKIMFMAFAAGG